MFVSAARRRRRGAARDGSSPTRVTRALAELEERVGDRKLILRSDRIEPSKNIVRGFLAFDRLLDEHPEWRERVVFVAMLNRRGRACPSTRRTARRSSRPRPASTSAGRRATGSPIVLDMRDDFPRSVAGFARYDVLLVNPIKDGLNLVAKEGPLVNRRDGVVCLSPEAGAFDELATRCSPVHPYDLEQTAGALHDGARRCRPTSAA